MDPLQTNLCVRQSSGLGAEGHKPHVPPLFQTRSTDPSLYDAEEAEPPAQQGPGGDQRWVCCSDRGSSTQSLGRPSSLLYAHQNPSVILTEKGVAWAKKKIKTHQNLCETGENLRKVLRSQPWWRGGGTGGQGKITRCCGLRRSQWISRSKHCFPKLPAYLRLRQ